MRINYLMFTRSFECTVNSTQDYTYALLIIQGNPETLLNILQTIHEEFLIIHSVSVDPLMHYCECFLFA